jgi:hypothetical protein
MDQIARCGYTVDNGSLVAAGNDEQLAAMRYMANDGAFFREMESASDGCDGVLSIDDYYAAMRDGTIRQVS